MPSNGRIAALVALLGVGAVALIGRVSVRPGRLFLYSYKSQNKGPGGVGGTSVATVATIAPGYFRVENVFPFGDWSTVAGAARGGKNWLFLHNRKDGSAATGLVDRNFTFQPAKYYPPGTYADWPYTYTVANGRGDLLSVGPTGTGDTRVGFAQVLDDGTFVEWWRTVLPGPGPSYGARWHATVVGLPDAHAWLRSDPPGPTGASPPGGCTVTVFDAKHATRLSTRRYARDWDGIVTDGNLVYLFDGFAKIAEVCAVDAAHQLVTVKPAQYDTDLSRDTYEFVGSARGAHLAYTYGSGAASVRTLGKGGFPSTLRVNGLYGFWDYANPC